MSGTELAKISRLPYRFKIPCMFLLGIHICMFLGQPMQRENCDRILEHYMSRTQEGIFSTIAQISPLFFYFTSTQTHRIIPYNRTVPLGSKCQEEGFYEEEPYHYHLIICLSLSVRSRFTHKREERPP